MVIPRKCKNGTMQVGCRCVISQSECALPVMCAVAGAVYFYRGLTVVGSIRVQPRYRWCLRSLRTLAPSAGIVASELNSYDSDSPQRTNGGSRGRSASAIFFFFFLTPFILFFSLFLIYSLALILFGNNYLQLSLKLGSS